MKKLFYTASLAALLAGAPLVAQNIPPASSGSDFKKVGAAGGQFLKLGVGARGVGMAAHSAVANDVTSIFWNPAGLVEIGGIGANFTYTQWFGGYSHNFAALSFPLSETYAVGVSMTSFGSGDIEQTTLLQPDGTGAQYNVSDFALGLTFAGKLTENFAFGATARYMSQSIWSLGASTVIFDIGTKYDSKINGIKLGFSIHNFGTDPNYMGEQLNASLSEPGLRLRPSDVQLITNAYALPLSFRAGLATDLFEADNFDVEDQKLLIAVDYETLADSPEQFAIGAEYSYMDVLQLRAGYRTGNDELGLSGGVGLKYDGGGFLGSIDYSASMTQSFGLLSRIGVTMTIK